MKKTLICILHYQLKYMTETLYNIMHNDNDNILSDIVIIDNGSDIVNSIDFTTNVIRIDNNIKFGGALNYAFKLVQHNRDKYDSLMFMGNDLITGGYDFVKSMRNLLYYDSSIKLVSPTIIQPEERQCYWNMMRPHYAHDRRYVKWIDFQCPLFHIDLIDKIQQYDNLLCYGWGNDVYTGMICKDNAWNIMVSDNITILHKDNQTVKQLPNDINNINYNMIAENNMIQFFKNINRYDEFLEYRMWAKK